MFNLPEIFEFIKQNDRESLKDYYDKCYNTLKAINKRSNLISLFILIICASNSFRNYITDTDLLGFKINQDVIKIVSPLLLPYFILEWCLIARRRRELMKVMKYIGFHIFSFPEESDMSFPYFSLHSRNIMPFSVMIELMNVDVKSKIHNYLIRLSIYFLFLGIPIYIGGLLYESLREIKSFTAIVCDLGGTYFLIQIFLFYKNEYNLIKKTNAIDKEFLKVVE